MRTSDFGTTLIKSFEAARLNAYLDVKGIPTIGWGCTIYEHGEKVKLGDKITLARARQLLDRQISMKEAAVNKGLGALIISQQRFDVLVSFTFNIGVEGFRTSTLLKKIKVDQNDSTIPAEFMRWINITVNGKLTPVKGLINRRKREADLWLRG